MSHSLKINDRAPNFTAPESEENFLELSKLDYDWIVLYFYPKDNTPGCTTEAREFTQFKAEFEQLNTTIIGISPDSPKTHKRFSEKHGLTLTLLSDSEHEIAELYGVWQLKKFMGKEYMGVVRSTFLINSEGRIAYIWTKVKAKGHAEVVLNKVKELLA
jgi:peroxiredoxin Q/BCP